MGKLIIFFLFSPWAFVSLWGLNLCINYTSELNEGAGVPATAFAFYQETLHTQLASSKSSYESFLLGSWGPRGAELVGGERRWVARVGKLQARLPAPVGMWAEFQTT